MKAEHAYRLSRFQRICLLVAILLLTGFSQSAHAERAIHVFGVFCNAYEGQSGAINEGVTADSIILNTIFSDYFSEQSWGVKLNRRTLEGKAATKEALLAEFELFSRNIGPEDTVYIHFSGHGVIRDPLSGEQFLNFVDESELSRNEWAKSIAALPCRLKILITDCCSSYPPEFVIAEGDERVEPWKNLYALLLEHEGFVDITAASPGQVALGSSNGGFLTINLESDMQRYSSWERVFEETQKRVEIETEGQIRMAGLMDEFDPQKPYAYSLGRRIENPEAIGLKRPESFEYVIPDSHTRELSEDELWQMGLQQLYLARNEIFARYGYDFNGAFLQEYFGSLSWYEKIPGFKSPSVSDLETANAALILKIEKEQGGPFISSKKVMPGEQNGAETFPDIFAYSSQRALSRSVLQAMTPQELSIARNEIYARHGYPFVSRALQNYFATKPYYFRDSSAKDPTFTDIENHNLWLIRKVERINGGAYSW
ncbi:MAG: YARHG domain-containing protein [Verrucomicrobiales bacterium]|nr:YARHG domain-containing protein [Verrucomicrobiales bacterium]